jgi:hypothetical protein
MPTFRLVPQFNDDPPDPADELPIEAAGSEAAKASALVLFDTFPLHVRTASVAIACGEGTDLDWLGAWDWSRGSEPVWSPDD